MAFSLIAHTFKAGNSSGAGTTTAIDTTGADLIVLVTSWYSTTANYNTATLSDSAGNTWTLIAENEASSGGGSAIWYCLNPTTSGTHTFTYSGASIYGSISALAFSGAAASSALDQFTENGAAAATSTTTGSVTPTEDNELVVAGVAAWTSAAAPSIDGGFTIPTDHSVAATGSVRVAHGAAYLIQTTAAAANPTWSWTNSASGNAVIATFKAAAAPSNTITITEQAQRVYQRTWSTDTASVTIAGTYTGTPTAVQYKITNHVGGATITDWTTLDASPTGGTFSGSVSVPAGGMYLAEVRFSNDTGVTDQQADQWGVGDLVAFTGQSNARNCFASTGAAYGTLLWFWSSTTSTHTPTAEWKQLTADSNGAEGFGDAWVAATGFPVGFLDTGVGSSSAATWQGGQTNYEAFEAAADANGSAIAAIVYWQGESEAGGTPSESGYEDDLYNDANSVIKQPRIDLSNPTTAAQIPFVLVLLGRNGTLTDANAQTVRNAQIDVADTAPGVYRVTIHDLPLEDSIHYTNTAYPIAGARAAQAALYALGLASYYRGPQIQYAVQVDADTVDVYLTHDGGTDITPTSAINGFEVFDDGTPVTISTAVRQSATVVRLGLASSIAGTLTLRHFYGADGGVTFNNTYTNALKDNSALGLPVENAESITVTDPPSGLLQSLVAQGAYI